MKTRRIIAIVIALGGIAILGISAYMQKEVDAGRGKIARGQLQIDSSKRLFSVAPEAAPIEEAVTGSGQARIDRGKRDAEHYEKLAHRLKFGGVILLVLGGALFFLKKRK